MKLNNIELLFLYFIYKGYDSKVIANKTVFDIRQVNSILFMMFKKLNAVNASHAIAIRSVKLNNGILAP